VKPFDELAIVEIAGSVAGAYAGKLFADHGARVLRLEPPGGDALQREGESWNGLGTLFAFLCTSQERFALDLASPKGCGELARLLERTDVVIESASPDPLAPITRDVALPHLVKVYVSPFGSTGPYARYRSNAFTDEAIGGHLYLNGEPDREPITRPGRHSEYQAGVHAFIGAMAALRARACTGRGQTLEVSHLEGLASLHQHSTTMWTHAGHVLRREGNDQPGMWHPCGVYPCKDGHVALVMPAQHFREAFLVAAGLASLLEDPRFQNDLSVGENKRAFDAAIEPWLREHSAAEIFRLGQAVFAPVGPVPGLLEVLEDEHLAARDYWVALGRSPSLRTPRAPFRVEGRDPVLAPPRAPRALDAGALGDPLPATHPRDGAPGSALAAGPLAGVRVLDLTRVWAGPLAGRLLGDLGADVILIEAPWARGGREVPPEAARITHLFPDNDVGERPWNRVGGFNKLNRNKRGITLRLDHPRGKALFEALVSHADVVLENYSPRVMPQLGLDFARLRELNPHLVYVAIPGYGSSGPSRDWVAFGPMIESGSGLSSLMGYADSGPYRSGIAWPDPVAGIHAVAATLLALHLRDTDPQRSGRRVEVAMIEAMTMLLGEELLAAQLRGGDPPRRGNRHPARAPQGCYPCEGEDRWIALSVTSDAEWRALCDLAGLDASLASLDLAGRLARHDRIDDALAAWTRRHSPHGLMQSLQARGLIACAALDARDLVEDPQLAARDFWAELEHPEAGCHRVPGLPIRFSATPATYRHPAPCLGQHNAEVLGELLGLGEAEIAELQETGVIVEAPPG
jgi:crotonobetainyl-CoA:carnitine CoA-transferase CaiB-like acyl-CoA transferase